MASTVVAFRKARAVQKDLGVVKDHLTTARVALAMAIATANEDDDLFSDLDKILDTLREASVLTEGEIAIWGCRANFIRNTIIDARKAAADAVDLAS